MSGGYETSNLQQKGCTTLFHCPTLQGYDVLQIVSHDVLQILPFSVLSKTKILWQCKCSFTGIIFLKNFINQFFNSIS